MYSHLNIHVVCVWRSEGDLPCQFSSSLAKARSSPLLFATLTGQQTSRCFSPPPISSKEHWDYRQTLPCLTLHGPWDPISGLILEKEVLVLTEPQSIPSNPI